MRPLYLEEFLWKPLENVREASWEDHGNFWLATDAPDGTHLRHTAGIGPIAQPSRRKRRPAIAIYVTPPGQAHRLPWLDEVDLDAGFVRYFGDNTPRRGVRAEAASGNSRLLDEIDLDSSADPAARHRAAPMIFFMNHGMLEAEF